MTESSNSQICQKCSYYVHKKAKEKKKGDGSQGANWPGAGHEEGGGEAGIWEWR